MGNALLRAALAMTLAARVGLRSHGEPYVERTISTGRNPDALEFLRR